MRNKEVELRRKSEKLEETNIALKVLLEHRDRDLIALEQRMTANIRELVLPYVEKLKNNITGVKHMFDEENLVREGVNNNLSKQQSLFTTANAKLAQVGSL